MVYPGLAGLGAAVACADQAYEGPAAVVFHHERAPAVPLAAVLAPPIVAGAHHLVVDDHVDALVAMPTFTLTIVNHGNVNHLKIVRN